MAKQQLLGLVTALALLLGACMSSTSPQAPPTTAATEGITIPTTEEEPSTAPTVEDLPETTEPAHCPLFHPQYSPSQIMEYFEEIVLATEYSDGVGNTALVQKWNTPMAYRIYGEPTQEDLAVLTDLFEQLNEIPGFPGIYAAADGELDNLSIRFLGPQAFTDQFSSFLGGEDAYGATQFWFYTATNDIYTADIGYRTDIDQQTRNSILLEEIFNMLGTSDTVLREDSIVYQYSNSNTALSDVDWIILKLLYDPAIQCGMDLESCRAIIGQLYY